MIFKNIFKLFLATIIVGLLNFVYADSGLTIGENQAQITANDYLNSHNLPYTASTSGYDSWQIKVKDTKTGQVQWMAYEKYESQFASQGSEPTGNERYIEIQNTPTAWIVHINDNGKNIGQIYINSETGEILKVTINGKVLENTMPQENQTNEDPSTSINTTNQVPLNTSNNTTGIILAITSISIIAGAVVGYWFKIRK